MTPTSRIMPTTTAQPGMSPSPIHAAVSKTNPRIAAAIMVLLKTFKAVAPAMIPKVIIKMIQINRTGLLFKRALQKGLIIRIEKMY